MKKCSECGERLSPREWEEVWNGEKFLEVCDNCRNTGEGNREVWFCWEHGEYFFSSSECPEIIRKKGGKIMKNFYTILYFEKGEWHNECVLYPTKKEAEKRKKFILVNMVQEYQNEEGKTLYKHFGEYEVQIFKIVEKVIFKKEVK